ncbi:MAG: hypothetical protein DLM68_03110 [Hyphomicrobiales bacterium]|nr:MAG: hypothetical protein DLM68_03110 [Hyphomicrobiales bacterium]
MENRARSRTLRAGELCSLRWDQVDLERGLIHVRRLKNGTPNVHPMGGTEMRALRRLMREQPESRYVFLTERRAPMTTGLRKMVARIGEWAEFPFPVQVRTAQRIQVNTSHSPELYPDHLRDMTMRIVEQIHRK